MKQITFIRPNMRAMRGLTIYTVCTIVVSIAIYLYPAASHR